MDNSLDKNFLGAMIKLAGVAEADENNSQEVIAIRGCLNYQKIDATGRKPRLAKGC